MSKITSQQYAAALYDQLLETPTKRQDQLISDFVTTVRQHEQIKLADQIIADFITYFDFQQNTIELVLISSLPLRNLHVLAAHLSQQIRRNIIIKNLIRPQIIGGLVIYFRDQKIDFSVTSKLKIRRSSDANSPFANQDINQIITLIRDDYPLFFTDNQPPQTLSDQIEIVK
ncbi:MAG TPA: F0F1 ATP synthase subunit delta, partial [bacterium]|nr:F0F1 ATP synthase subunit delta [bacterium]